jgi:hypothetical protein
MDVVVEMGVEVKCPLPADFKGRLIQWDIPDPYFHDRDCFRDVWDSIACEVGRLLADLVGVSGNSNLETANSKIENGKWEQEEG